jgi:hypothetical protein
MTEEQVAESYSGVRYERLGRGPSVFDCWGLVLSVRARLGRIPPIDPMAAARRPCEMVEIVAAAYRASDWVPGQAGRGGDIAMFPSMARCLHAGVWLAGGVLDISQTAGLRWRSVEQLAQVRMETWEWAVSG